MDSAQGHKESDGTERPSSQAQRSHSQGPQGSPHWDLRGPVSVQPWGCRSVHTHIRPQRRGGEERTEAVSRKPARNVQTILASAQKLRGRGPPPPLESCPFPTWSGHPMWALSQRRGAILMTPCSPQKRASEGGTVQNRVLPVLGAGGRGRYYRGPAVSRDAQSQGLPVQVGAEARTRLAQAGPLRTPAQVPRRSARPVF